jgi:CPA2 family monovalent cation:H+ antiporter-2
MVFRAAWSGPGRKASIEAALILAAGGEFAFVMLDNAMSATSSRAIGQAVLVSATLTMFLIPALAALGGHLGRKANTQTSEAPQVKA